MDQIVSGVSTKNNKLPNSNDSGVGIIMDDSDVEIFDDSDEDDVANTHDSGELPSSSLDYRDMLAAGASAIVAPVKNAIKPSDDDRSGGSYDRSEDSADDDDDDTESEDDEDAKNGKGGHASDSGEDYTDDEDEGEDGYRPGGYHPVKIGEVYNQR